MLFRQAGQRQHWFFSMYMAGFPQGKIQPTDLGCHLAISTFTLTKHLGLAWLSEPRNPTSYLQTSKGFRT